MSDEQDPVAKRVAEAQNWFDGRDYKLPEGTVLLLAVAPRPDVQGTIVELNQRTGGDWSNDRGQVDRIFQSAIGCLQLAYQQHLARFKPPPDGPTAANLN